MRSPTIGRTLAIAVITAFFAWNAVRLIGARPVAEPRYPFPKPIVDAALAASKSQQTAVLAGGCFWGVQAVFEHLKGVGSVIRRLLGRPRQFAQLRDGQQRTHGPCGIRQHHL